MAVSFEKAKREKTYVKVLLSGPSGSGKSYSALLLATGMAKKCKSRIAYIGTESSRNKYYADTFDYDLLELEEPFTSEKYIEAIDAAVDAGYKVLIIDSMTHEWKWLNDTHDNMPGNSWANWGKLKPRHHKFIEKIMESPINIISTARGKDEWVLEDNNGKQVPKKVGMGAQQDKDISYEYTVSWNIAQDTHIASVDKDNTKLFDGKYEKLTENDGEMLYEWANSGKTATPKKKETPKFEETSYDPDEVLVTVQDEIIRYCQELGGTKNEALMKLLKGYAKSGNPRQINDIDKAKECLEKVKSIPPTQ